MTAEARVPRKAARSSPTRTGGKVFVTDGGKVFGGKVVLPVSPRDASDSRRGRCPSAARTSRARPQRRNRTETSTPNAASTRIAAAATDASRSPPPNSRVDDERQRLGPALDVAGEHDRRPELAEGPRPAHDGAGGERRSGQRRGDPPEDLAFRRPVDAGGVLDVAVDRRRSRPAPTARRTAPRRRSGRGSRRRS